MSCDLKNLKSDYGNFLAEVTACRTSAALFDFSFMFSVQVFGLDVIAQLTDGNLYNMKPGKIRYALSYSELGYLRSDLTIWRISLDNFLVMSSLCADIEDLIKYSQHDKDCYVEDLSEKITIYAVQGLESLKALNGLVNDKNYHRFLISALLNLI